jgi:hypothetical protein
MIRKSVERFSEKRAFGLDRGIMRKQKVSRQMKTPASRPGFCAPDDPLTEILSRDFRLVV